jgi:hypothetical protein
MKADNNERDAQQRALRDDAATSNDPAADRYRLVYRIVRVADMPELPADFASQMERIAGDQHEPARPALVETWTVRIVLATTIVAALGFALPALTAARALLDRTGGMPWTMLLAVGVAMLAVWVVDRCLPERQMAAY